MNHLAFTWKPQGQPLDGAIKLALEARLSLIHKPQQIKLERGFLGFDESIDFELAVKSALGPDFSLDLHDHEGSRHDPHCVVDENGVVRLCHEDHLKYNNGPFSVRVEDETKGSLMVPIQAIWCEDPEDKCPQALFDYAQRWIVAP